MPPETRRALEAIVMVADSPVDAQLLAQLTETSVAEVEAALAELAEGYRREERGFELVQVAGGWRFQSHPDQAAYVERFVLEGQTAKLSAAALETLAIIAYKQPISRAQVAAIRGVSVDGVVRTLEQRGYIGEVARDPGPGQAILFGTTPLFLDKLGLNSLSDLPAIADFVPGADVVEALEVGLRIEAAPTEPAPVGDEEAASPAAASAWRAAADDTAGTGDPAPPPGLGAPATDADADAGAPSADTGAPEPGEAHGGTAPEDTAGTGDPAPPPGLGTPPGERDDAAAERPSLDELLDGEG